MKTPYDNFVNAWRQQSTTPDRKLLSEYRQEGYRYCFETLTLPLLRAAETALSCMEPGRMETILLKEAIDRILETQKE